ncbi:hypothetical protein ACS0PU_009129 [Formica fusca]
MVGRTIPLCNNSSEKEYVMKILPRNTQRRVQWINNINTKYKNCIPSNHSCLCEVHFEPEMWEQRIDNKRKLKQKAVPTIFQYYQKKKIFRISQKPDVIEITVLHTGLETGRNFSGGNMVGIWVRP